MIYTVCLAHEKDKKLSYNTYFQLNLGRKHKTKRAQNAEKTFLAEFRYLET